MGVDELEGLDESEHLINVPADREVVDALVSDYAIPVDDEGGPMDGSAVYLKATPLLSPSLTRTP